MVPLPDMLDPPTGVTGAEGRTENRAQLSKLLHEPNSFWSRLWDADTRIIELGLGATALGRGVLWQMEAGADSARVYGVMLDIATLQHWGWLAMVVGLLLIVAVRVNGTVRATPYFRMTALAFISFCFTLLGLVLAMRGTVPAFQGAYSAIIVASGASYCLVNISSKLPKRG